MFDFQSDADVVDALLELADNGTPTRFMATLDGIVEAAKILRRLIPTVLNATYFCSCKVFRPDPNITAVVCVNCGKPPRG